MNNLKYFCGGQHRREKKSPVNEVDVKNAEPSMRNMTKFYPQF